MRENAKGSFVSGRILFVSRVADACGQTDQQGAVVGLCASVQGRAVSSDLTAFFTAVNDDESLSGVRLGADGHHASAARVGTVTGVDIHVE